MVASTWKRIFHLLTVVMLAGKISSFQQKLQLQHRIFKQYQSIFALSSTTSKTSEEKDFEWDRIADDVFRKDKRPIILFDGVCNLCNGGVNFALDNDSIGMLNVVYFDFIVSLIPKNHLFILCQALLGLHLYNQL